MVRTLLNLLADAPAGVYFDVFVSGLDPDFYEGLPGRDEEPTYDASSGSLLWAKDIDLPGGTVTVETSYERVAA